MDGKVPARAIDFTREFVLKSEAIRFEKWLKTGVGRDFIKALPSETETQCVDLDSPKHNY